MTLSSDSSSNSVLIRMSEITGDRNPSQVCLSKTEDILAYLARKKFWIALRTEENRTQGSELSRNSPTTHLIKSLLMCLLA